jgi:uncharacterized integral membrane protein
MTIPGFIERHLDNLASGITRNPALSLLAFLLFADSLLVKLFETNLLSIDTNWVKEHLGISGSLLMVGAYILIQELAFPWLRFFCGLPFFLGTEVLIYRAFRRFGVRLGIRDEDFLVYAIVKDNSVAYEEYKRRKAQHVDGLRKMELSLGLLALTVVNLLVVGNVRPVSVIALEWSLKLPVVMFIILVIVVLFVLLFLLFTACL